MIRRYHDGYGLVWRSFSSLELKRLPSRDRVALLPKGSHLASPKFIT